MIGSGNSYTWFPDHFKYKRIICIFSTEDIFCHITKEKHKKMIGEKTLQVITINKIYFMITNKSSHLATRRVILLSKFSFNFILIEDFFLISAVRQQINQNTHYLDLSNIYGSKNLAANNLRTKTDGNLS